MGGHPLPLECTHFLGNVNFALIWRYSLPPCNFSPKVQFPSSQPSEPQGSPQLWQGLPPDSSPRQIVPGSLRAWCVFLTLPGSAKSVWAIYRRTHSLLLCLFWAAVDHELVGFLNPSHLVCLNLISQPGWYNKNPTWHKGNSSPGL